MLQTAGADAVGPLLVFLDLLERQPEGVPEIGLESDSQRNVRVQSCIRPVNAAVLTAGPDVIR